MASRISPRLTRLYTPGGGFRAPQVSRTARGLSPLFADQFQSMLVTGYENVTVTLYTPVISPGATATVTGTQGLQTIRNLTITATDQAQTHIGNVSVTAPSGLIVGHPQVQITTVQGTPVGGALASGQAYTKLKLAVTATIFSPAGSAANAISVTATVMLLGTALGN